MPITFHEWGDPVAARRTAAALGDDAVQVWLAALPAAAADVAELTSQLSRDERERAARFRVSESRQHFLVGRILLRQLLAACLNVEAAALEFAYQPHGKPVLSRPAAAGNLRFNLSHSGGWFAIALARGREIGVDIESLRDDSQPWLPLACRIFSTRELRELHALPTPELQRRGFFQGWTRKEAYLKATGEGLTDTLAAIEVTLTPGKPPELLRLPGGCDSRQQWSIRDIPLPPDFAGAVVFATLPAADTQATD